jgi:hypothetical protein
MSLKNYKELTNLKISDKSNLLKTDGYLVVLPIPQMKISNFHSEFNFFVDY